MLMTKLFSTNLTKEHRLLALDLIGEEALREPTRRRGAGLHDPGAHAGAWLSHYMFSLAPSIAGGASNIQRNIIGERGLGLPRDLRPPA